MDRQMKRRDGGSRGGGMLHHFSVHVSHNIKFPLFRVQSPESIKYVMICQQSKFGWNKYTQ